MSPTKGLPCLPPAAQLYGNKHPSDVPIIPSKTTTVNLTLTIVLVATTALCFLIIISLLIMNYILRRRLRKQTAMLLSGQGGHDFSNASDLFNPVDESNIVDLNTDLYTPFLSQTDEELPTPTKEANA
jgi:hypothetical protein